MKLRSLASLRVGNPLPRLRWHLQHGADRLGRTGVVLAALAVGAAGWQLLVQEPHLRQLADERQALTADLARLAKVPRQEAPGDELGAELRKVNANMQKLQVFETLKKYGIDASESTYRQDAEVKGKLARWTLGITATGRYADLSRALQALSQQRFLRVESVTLTRPRIEDVTLNIGLRVSLLGAEK
ncbi:hypothetical protein [Trinickia mobilis]|uniref:hypothetical protein n=1 Tax=Trinickia mobilis TaxID=2816356 RepID=UPI001A8F424C|nr:hypothetical protein [Trinickia mobilis]